MNESIRAHLDHIYATDKTLQNQAYFAFLEATDQPVDWAYEAWDNLIEGLRHTDNHVRAIASQILCGLAKSDPEKRMLKDFEILLTVTKDERFVTARHCMQSLWKVGVSGAAQRQVYLDGLQTRFLECVGEKNGTLIRYDILQSLRKVYDHVKDETLREKALAWLETEDDLKYRKKYKSLWK